MGLCSTSRLLRKPLTKGFYHIIICVLLMWLLLIYKTGKGGFLSRKILGWKLVRFDFEKEEPLRDRNGFCIPCKGRTSSKNMT